MPTASFHNSEFSQNRRDDGIIRRVCVYFLVIFGKEDFPEEVIAQNAIQRYIQTKVGKHFELLIMGLMFL